MCIVAESNIYQLLSALCRSSDVHCTGLKNWHQKKTLRGFDEFFCSVYKAVSPQLHSSAKLQFKLTPLHSNSKAVFYMQDAAEITRENTAVTQSLNQILIKITCCDTEMQVLALPIVFMYRTDSQTCHNLPIFCL